MTDISHPQSNIVRTIKRRLNFLTVTIVALAVVVGVIAAIALTDAATTHDALCTFKSDLAKRIVESSEFLKTHPNGFAGISQAEIAQSIANQQRTLDSLSVLKC